MSSDRKLKCIGYDSSKSMIEIAKSQKKKSYKNQSSIEYKIKDITENIKYDNAGVVIACLTLQFIDPKKRNGIVENMFRQLKD
jgi:ubiquinone/menaquinone biosynthesis C-methylase UbiE